jgi:calpain-15
LAELPSNIIDRFETKEINKAGIYLVTLFVNGIKTPVVVDDWIPVNRSNRPVFASNKDQEIWVILLEKAWAKLHRTYARTEAGLPSFATIHLLGTPAKSYFHDEMKSDADKFWADLKRFDKREYLMMAAS